MSSIEEYRTKCPFCSVQDDVILKREKTDTALFTGENIFGLYYDKKTDRGLCPRGNFTRELISSPHRLRDVLVGGKARGFEKSIKDCSKKLKKIKKEKNKIGILIGGNHTLEEAYLAKELANQLNTELVGLFPLEDEALLSIKNDFSFDDLKASDCIMAVGDIFSNSPTLSKLILDARNRERENHLLYLDTVGGRVGPFAESFYPGPGYMNYFLSLMLNYLEGKKSEVGKTEIGLDEGDFDSILSALKNSKEGWILFSNIFGHFRKPHETVYLLEELAQKTENHFAVVPIGQNSLGVGRVAGEFNNEKIINGLREGELKGLITLGALPREIIPDYDSHSKNLDISICSTFFRDGEFSGFRFPTRLSFEKEGSLISLEEEIVTSGDSVPPVGGTLSDGETITHLIKEISGKSVKAEVKSIKPLPSKNIEKIGAPGIKEDEEFPYVLVGIGLPYHHGEGEITRKMEWNMERGWAELYMNPGTYRETGNPEKVKVTTPFSSGEFVVGNVNNLPAEIPEGVVVLPVHYPEVRKLFSPEIDAYGMFSPGPVKARLEQ